MTVQRQGEVALLMTKYRFRKEGIRLKPDMMRDVANTAKEIGITSDEAKEFLEIIVTELVKEVFPPRSFSSHKEDHGPEV